MGFLSKCRQIIKKVDQREKQPRQRHEAQQSTHSTDDCGLVEKCCKEALLKADSGEKMLCMYCHEKEVIGGLEKPAVCQACGEVVDGAYFSD